jgi:hypothetical protein
VLKVFQSETPKKQIMKLMKHKWILAGAALMVAATVQATPVIGSIGIDAANGTTLAIDETANTVKFTPASPTANADVNQATGSFSGLLGQSATYKNFTYSPLSVSNPIWILTSGAASFDLLSITEVDEGVNSLVLFGTGTIHMTGFDDTFGTWSFSATSTSGNFNWEATTTAAPDGGTTVMLLGAGLSGLALLRRKLA